MKFTVVKHVDGDKYHDAISDAMKEDIRSKFVEIKGSEVYDNMNVLMLIDDGTAGIAVTEDKEIVSLFKNKLLLKEREEKLPALDLLIPSAVVQGGAHMNCYGEHLAKNYMKHGFVPIARVKFDESEVKDWDYEHNGRPDIYFLVRFTSDMESLIRESANFDESWFDFIKDSLPYMTYPEAQEYTKEKLRTISEVPNTSFKRVIDSVVLEGEMRKQGGISL